MSLNKNLLQEYRNKIQAKLDELDLDVELNIGNCSYGESHATFKLELQVKGGDSTNMHPATWRRHVHALLDKTKICHCLVRRSCLSLSG